MSVAGIGPVMRLIEFPRENSSWFCGRFKAQAGHFGPSFTKKQAGFYRSRPFLADHERNSMFVALDFRGNGLGSLSVR
jgi:hypothetical protein